MILENINKIPEYNITDVAEMCFVSTATISRLCRKLNYESFSDFKMDVTMNLRYFNHDSMRMQFDHQLPVFPVEGKTTKDLFSDHFENIVQNLRSTYEMIEFEELEKLVDLIYQSNEICFAGNFFTQSVSMQLQIELSYLGKKCTGMYPLQSQKEVVHDLTENDLLARRQSGGSGALCIVPGLAVQAVKSTDLTVVRHQVNTERYAETSAMYRPEYSGME